ncbi:MAG: ATP-binding protein [Acidobacteria bacterium]|nr:ATP-binding protein [Acidobacteriota bacterium]MBI3423870.1 ATP-binding protein [Acidobacteriota bacterium]
MDQPQSNGLANSDAAVPTMPGEFVGLLDEEINLAGGAWQEDKAFQGAVGRTMYDMPASKDNTVTILLPAEEIRSVPSQSLVRIKSRPLSKGGDGRQYVAAVVEGPFAEPDGLRADAPLVVTTTVRGATFTPRYHGRVQAEILGEEFEDKLVPPRFRPLPNSPVFVIGEAETAERLRLLGDVTIGLAVGYESVLVSFSTARKDVLPRHTGILGTTGGGKSTTVSGLIGKLGASGVAVVIFDTEGEYTQMMQQTEDAVMLTALAQRGLAPQGVKNVGLYHLVGRATTNAQYADRKEFCLKYENLSPHAVMEILDFNPAQEERFLKAYDIARRLMRDPKINPFSKADEEKVFELDEMEQGYPRLILQMMYEIVRMCADTVEGSDDFNYLQVKPLRENSKQIQAIIKESKLPGHIGSWRKVQGSLSRLLRLKIFDNPQAAPPNYKAMTEPSRITIIDLSDTDSPQINNLAISEILRGLHLQQDENYQASEKGEPMRKVVVVIEEAHEFLSKERIKQMPVLHQQIERIAKRGRKRWLGLMFVTQLPQHLPDEVLGLINNYVLHKIADVNVINRLKRSLGSVDEGLWNRLPNLTPGQALVLHQAVSDGC